MMKKLILGAILTIAAAAAHAGDALQISDLGATVYGGGGNGYVTGTATNTTTTRIQTATIAINLLDASGAIVGTTSATATGIEPGQQWKFRAPTTQPYNRAAVASVTAS
ncbi:FxLYD domain-containing protein [Paraburkholderia pallida]|uniref:DUF5666 domain-containing protein n=1 Tax=Paraburkholderia pallida TaxID=2547399 RepID=A0A4P7CN56_9BURK|nr:FxLYD domain-containing protein [Paraburkholderia pallida]QBQ97210.1 hypothetical protein E1956_08495 [Paraburkholderia pallida]